PSWLVWRASRLRRSGTGDRGSLESAPADYHPGCPGRPFADSARRMLASLSRGKCFADFSTTTAPNPDVAAGWKATDSVPGPTEPYQAARRYWSDGSSGTRAS